LKVFQGNLAVEGRALQILEEAIKIITAGKIKETS
jgi:hypothetical protein